MTKFAFILLSFLSVLSILIPEISVYDHADINLTFKNMPPSMSHLFGTDDLGRDLFTRVWCGARISLFIGCSAALIDMILGIIYGSIAGYIGGNTDNFMMRLCDILHTIPYLLFVILLTCVRGSGLITILIAMTATGWINMARITRTQVMHLKNKEFVLSAKCIGASNLRILIKHILPNATAPVIAAMTLTIPSAIFTEAFLSFLGLGIQAPHASWGTMVSEGLSAMRFYPWRLFFPACMITLTMLCFNQIGNTLREKHAS